MLDRLLKLLPRRGVGMPLLVRVECYLGKRSFVRHRDSFEEETKAIRISEELAIACGATLKDVHANIAGRHVDIRSANLLMVQIYRKGRATAALTDRLDTVLDVAIRDGDRIVFLEPLPA